MGVPFIVLQLIKYSDLQWCFLFSILQIFEGYYHFVHNGITKRSLRPHLGKRVQLAVDTRVKWAAQQKAKKRVKRDFRIQDSDPRWPSMWYLVSWFLTLWCVNTREKEQIWKCTSGMEIDNRHLVGDQWSRYCGIYNFSI